MSLMTTIINNIDSNYVFYKINHNLVNILRLTFTTVIVFKKNFINMIYKGIMKSNYSNLSNTYNSKQLPIMNQPDNSIPIRPIYPEEVFYYNTSTGYTHNRSIQIGLDYVWPLADRDQLYDAYMNGMDIPTWGWGLDGRKYWFSKAPDRICDGNKSPGFYVENAKQNDDTCGIFFYAKKPLERDNWAKCFIDFKLTTQLCVFPWRQGQWSKYSSPPFIPITCYQEGENPFQDKCSKSYCCEGTTLRLHPADDTHKDPYYICSGNTDYTPNKPPKCEKGLSLTCLNSPFLW
jgi:hypothetical protein